MSVLKPLAAAVLSGAAAAMVTGVLARRNPPEPDGDGELVVVNGPVSITAWCPGCGMNPKLYVTGVSVVREDGQR